jgi:hypothetical protein
VVHPDTGGDDDLFVWVRHLQEHVAGDSIDEPPRHTRRAPPRHKTTGERIDYTRAYDIAYTFDELTARALIAAQELEEPYRSVLFMLEGCYEVGRVYAPLYYQQHLGATYKQLAAIAHRVGMSKEQRVKWYRIAESIPLSQRHAGHIMDRLV